MQTRIQRITAFCGCLLLASVVIAMTMMGTMGGNSPHAYAMQFTGTPTTVATSSTDASTYVTPGTLSMQLTPVTQPTAVTLNGSDQTETFSLPIVVEDYTGSGAGWGLSLALTPFTNTNNSDTLSSGAAVVLSAPNPDTCNDSGTCALPTNGIAPGSYPVALTASNDSSTSSQFYSANTNTGMGSATVTPQIQVTIPAKAYVGTYSSTFTVSITTGP